SYCVFGQEFQKEGDWAKYVKSVIVFGKAELVEDADEIVRISRLLCDKFPCPKEYVENEISKDAPRTLVIAINIEDMNGKLVHEA
ncbi:MAG: pyridoxamine 5'-phosphate oxidase family protein, partial [Clostridiales bacterium]|nr:pyridoxamine 5'-phosphate oxidase family protein [Clostridiales bacterium]